MKLKSSMHLITFLITICCLSCDFAELKFIVVNKTGRTLTIYRPRTLPLDKTVMYRLFKPKHSANLDVPDRTHISFDFQVEPFAKKEDLSMYSFSSQFKTTDGKLHLIILDVDSLKSMALQQTLNSNSISRAILKHLIISKDELEKNDKIITYND